MSKINNKDFQFFPHFPHRPGDGYNYSDGSSFGSDDSCIYSDGDSNGGGVSYSFITSIVDPTVLSPLLFFLKEKETEITWDDAWNIATEDEKMILIQLMQLR
jgi:hypothetical protein